MSLTIPSSSSARNGSASKSICRPNRVKEEALLTPKVQTLFVHLGMYLRAARCPEPTSKKYGVCPHQYVTEGFNGTALKLNELIRWGNFLFLESGILKPYRIPNDEVNQYLSKHVAHLSSSLNYQAERYCTYLSQFSAILEEALQSVCKMRNKAQNVYRREEEFKLEADSFRLLGRKIDRLLTKFSEESETVRRLIESSYPITQVLESDTRDQLSFPLTFPFLFSKDQLIVHEKDAKDALKVLTLLFQGTSRLRIPDKEVRSQQASCSLIESSSAQFHTSEQPSALTSLGYFDLLERMRSYQESWVSTLRQVKNLILGSADILEREGKSAQFSSGLIQKIKGFFGNAHIMTSIECPRVHEAFDKKRFELLQNRDLLSEPAQQFLESCCEQMSHRLMREHQKLMHVSEQFREFRDSMIAASNQMTRPYLPGKKILVSRKVSERFRNGTTVISDLLDQVYQISRASKENRQQLQVILRCLKGIDPLTITNRQTFQSGFPAIKPLILDRKEGSIEREFNAIRDFYLASAEGFQSITKTYELWMAQIQEMYLFLGEMLQCISSEEDDLYEPLDIDGLMIASVNRYAPTSSR